MGEEVEITTKSLSFHSSVPPPAASVPSPFPLCPSPHLGPCFYSAGCYPASPASSRSAPLCPSPHLGPCFYSAGCYPASPASSPFRSLCALPCISAPVFIPPWRIALTWQFEREEPRGAMLRPRLLSGIPSSLCIPPASLRESITQAALPFLTGLFHSHPRFYSPGMGSSEPLLISPVVPPSPTLAQIIVCGIISAFSTTGCLYIFFIIIIVCFVNFQRTSFLVD